MDGSFEERRTGEPVQDDVRIKVYGMTEELLFNEDNSVVLATLLRINRVLKPFGHLLA